jgi:hypothetical protein
MALDWPAAPTNGQQYSGGGVTWTFDGVKWTAAGLGPGFLPLTGGTLSGNVAIAPPAGNSPALILDKAASGLANQLLSQMNGLGRWNLFFGDTVAESGSNAGSNLTIQALSDTGALLSTPLAINRATGLVATPNLSAPQAIVGNRVDNGDMWIDQHNAGAVVVVPNGAAFCPDRFNALNLQATSRFNVQQNLPAITTKAPGFSYFLGAQSTGAYASAAAAQLLIQHGIEADNIGDLMMGTANAQPFTVSFWARSSLTGNFSFTIQSGAPTTSGGTLFRAYVTTYSLPTANTWTKIAITIPGDVAVNALAWPNAGNGPGMYLSWDLGSGTTHQIAASSAWQTTAANAASGAVHVTGTNNATFGLTGVKLEPGSFATPFPVQTLSERWARCQRYLLNTNGILLGVTTSNAQWSTNPAFGFPTVMRAVPTLLNGSFSVSSGNVGTPYFAGGGQFWAAFVNGSNNWTQGEGNAAVSLVGMLSAEI